MSFPSQTIRLILTGATTSVTPQAPSRKPYSTKNHWICTWEGSFLHQAAHKSSSVQQKPPPYTNRAIIWIIIRTVTQPNANKSKQKPHRHKPPKPMTNRHYLFIFTPFSRPIASPSARPFSSPLSSAFATTCRKTGKTPLLTKEASYITADRLRRFESQDLLSEAHTE